MERERVVEGKKSTQDDSQPRPEVGRNDGLFAGRWVGLWLVVALLGLSSPASAVWWQVVVESSPQGLVLHDAQVIPG